MEYKKSMIIIIMAIFLFSIASVCASDVNDTAIASEDTTAIELSQSGEITTTDESQKTIQTNDTEMLTASDEETTVAQNNLDTLSFEEKTYADLSNAVGSGGNINLQPAYYKYNGESDTITITNPGIINGNGAIIDMAGSTIRAFTVNTEGVTINNLTIKNANYTGDGGAIYFSSYASSGTVENCNFTNNKAIGYDSCGGAVYFGTDGTVTNCNFTNNSAGYGGAVYFCFVSTGTVTNCNFTNNTVGINGGAVYFGNTGNVENCNFTDNTAGDCGGAILFVITGTVENCNFTNNSASSRGGAVYFSSTGNVSNCNFTGNTADYGGAIRIYSGTVSNCNFTNNTAKMGNAIYINNKCTISDCDFTNNPITKGAIHSVTGDITLSNNIINFDDVVSDKNFTEIQKLIDRANDGDEITINGLYAGFGIPIRITKSLTLNGQNNTTLDAKKLSKILYITANNVIIKNIQFSSGYADYGGAIYFSSTGTVTNCNFVNNTASVDGGAVYFYFVSTGTVTNCNFVNNTASVDGGAVYFSQGGNVTNCNFTDNTATYYGGAVYFGTDGTVTNCNFTNNSAREGGAIWIFSSNVTNNNFANNKADYAGGAISGCGEVINCNFTDNNAPIGSAFYFYPQYYYAPIEVTDPDDGTTYLDWVRVRVLGTVSNSIFLNNRADAEELQVIKNDNNITIIFTGKDNLLNAMYFEGDLEVNIINATYWGANGIANTDGSAPVRSNKEAGQNITVGVVVNDDLVLSEVKVTDEKGMIVLDISAGENYYIRVCHDMDSYYTEAEKTISNNTKFNVNVTSQTTYNMTVNVTAKSNIFSEVMPGKLLFILPNGDEINATYADGGIWWAEHTFDGVGDYNVGASYIGLDDVIINNATISIRYDARVEVKNKTLNLLVGDDIVIVVTTVPVGVNISYVPDDSGVYSLKDGIVTALREGTGNILIKVGGGGVYVENSTEIAINVSKVPTAIRIENPTLKLEIGDEVATGATLTPADAGNLTYTVSNSSVVKINDGKIIALAEGEATINVSFTGDKKYEDAENKTIAVNVTLKDVSVSLNNSTLDLFVGDNFTVVATTNPQGLNVSFVQDDSGVYSVDENGTVTALRNGTGNILVKVGGDGVYAANSTEIPVTVSKVPTEIKIASPTGEMSVGAMGHVAAELIPSDAGNLTYASNDTSVVNVSSTGVIKANNAGIALITVSFAGDKKYAAAENKTIAITVNLKDASISVNNSTLDLKVGDNFTIVAATDPAGLNVSFVQDDSGVYSVDGNGTVTALKVGTGNILVKVGDGKVYAENSTEIAVTVSKIATEINLANETIELKVYKSIGDLATLSPAEAGNLTYTSSDEDIVLVSEDGIIYARAKGNASVTVSFVGNDKYKAAENRTITVNVALNDASVSVENDTIDLNVDDAFIINATADPSFLTVYYASSNESVAVVTDYGNVKAVGEGTAIITLTVGNGETYAVNSTNVTVTVSKIPTEITVNATSLDLFVGDETVITANLTPAGAGNVTFTSGNETVVIVDADGNVIANGKGQAIITFSFAGDNKYASAENRTVTVNVRLNDASVTVDNAALDLKVGETCAINATKHPDTILLDITYTSSNSSVARVDEKGVVTAVGEGSAVITVEVGDGEIYAINSTNVTVTVSRIATEIVADPVTATYNIDKNLVITLKDANGNPVSGENITVDLNGAKNYTTDENGSVIVSTKGLAPGIYAANIIFNGTNVYVKSASEVNVTVKKATPKITAKAKTFKTTTKTKKYTITLKNNIGKPIRKVTVYLKVGGKTYKATTNSQGKATFKITKLNNKGTYKATVTYKGNKYYNKATKKVTIKVKSVWKTVSKGSKNSAIVKKIQRALKNNGYYLEYNGRYLMVDGIFWDYTEMAVKEFQNDKVLKVTGKVDEKTAKKLGII